MGMEPAARGNHVRAQAKTLGTETKRLPPLPVEQHKRDALAVLRGRTVPRPLQGSGGLLREGVPVLPDAPIQTQHGYLHRGVSQSENRGGRDTFHR